MVFMVCVLGFSAYRYEVVDHPIPVRVIGPDGSQHRELSRAASWIWNQDESPVKKWAKRMLSAFVKALSHVHDGRVGNDFSDIAEHFVKGIADNRAITRRLFTVLKVRSDEAREKDGSRWLKPKGSLHRKVGDMIVAIGLITHALTRAGIFDGQDPSKIDKARSRTGGRGSVLARTRNGLRSDVDNLWRLKSNPTVAPRMEDPRFFDRLLTGLDLTGAAEQFPLICRLGHGAGGRAMSILRLDLFDVLVRARKPGQYPSPNKGDEPEERNFVMIPPEDVDQAILAWIDEGRRELTGESLAMLRAVAADPLMRDTLKGEPLFTENGSDFITYNRLYRVVRNAAERMDLFIDDEEWRTTGRKRFVTFHYLRHEYVHRRLDKVAGMKNEADQKNERAAIIRYMRWKGQAMLDWYSAHHKVKLAEEAAQDFNQSQDQTLETAAHTAQGDLVASRAAGELVRGLS